MKTFACVVTVAIVATIAMAEPPQYRRQRQFFARQQEETTPAPADAPYPPSGWKPAGPAFELPQRQVSDAYGAPEPSTAYGPPTTTEAPTTTTVTEEPTTTLPPPVDSGNELDEESSGQGEQQGEYYVALPDGRLQRVQYVSREDAAAMRYLAKIQAQNVGPIYAYNPLQKLEFASPLKLEAAPVSLVASPLASSSYTTVTTNYQPTSGTKLVFTV